MHYADVASYCLIISEWIPFFRYLYPCTVDVLVNSFLWELYQYFSQVFPINLERTSFDVLLGMKIWTLYCLQAPGTWTRMNAQNHSKTYKWCLVEAYRILKIIFVKACLRYAIVIFRTQADPCKTDSLLECYIWMPALGGIYDHVRVNFICLSKILNWIFAGLSDSLLSALFPGLLLRSYFYSHRSLNNCRKRFFFILFKPWFPASILVHIRAKKRDDA